MSDVLRSRLPSRIASLSESPPWCRRIFGRIVEPDPDAKENLDQLNDVVLFGRRNLVLPPMAVATRALLYLWNGWPEKCVAIATAAQHAEKNYLLGLSARQVGDLSGSKKYFEELTIHPIHSSLGATAIGMAAKLREPALEPLWISVESRGSWDPLAFLDVYGTALGGSMTTTALASIDALQIREFELLLEFTVAFAIGDSDVKPANASRNTARNSRLKSGGGHGSRESNRSRPKVDGRGTDLLPPAKSMAAVSILCPKCQGMNLLPESARGKQERCKKCGAAFLVPPGGRPAMRQRT